MGRAREGQGTNYVNACRRKPPTRPDYPTELDFLIHQVMTQRIAHSGLLTAPLEIILQITDEFDLRDIVNLGLVRLRLTANIQVN